MRHAQSTFINTPLQLGAHGLHGIYEPLQRFSLSDNKQNKNERTSMNNKFDELAKGLAQATTRRQALKKFGAAAAGAVLACFGLANSAEAHKRTCGRKGNDCGFGYPPCCPGLTCTFGTNFPVCA
jgi:hypothetical protein